MTVTEKIAQLSAVRVADLITAGELDTEKLAQRLSFGTAAVTGVSSIPDIDPARYLAVCGRLQSYLDGQTRLGIPAFICEGPHSQQGLFNGDLIPPAIAMAASFDTALVREMAGELRAQLSALGVSQILAPGLAVVRAPHWMGLSGSFGAQPYLVGRMGVAYLRGMRGETDQGNVLATAMSFVTASSHPAGEAQGGVHLGRRELREILAEPFAAAIREAGLSGIVTADTTIDGIACTGAPEVLSDLLRTELGFRGLVVSAANGVRNLIERHRVAADELSATALALSAGVDVELSGGCYSATLEDALEGQLINIEALDTAVRRVLWQKLQIGLLDDQPVKSVADAASAGVEPDAETPAAGADSDCEEQLSRLAARLADEAVVLVKNTLGALPLSTDVRLALYGNDISALANALSVAGLVAGVQVETSQIADQAEVLIPSGCDAAIVCLEVEPTDAGELPRFGEAQLNLLRNLLACELPVSVVLSGTSAFAIGLLPAELSAILINWSPGAVGLEALAKALVGKVNPSGRLPVAVPQFPGEWATQAPLFGFGHGLTYSHFEYGELQSVDTVDTHGAIEVSVVIINESELAGTEVVQLYLQDLVAEVTRPLRQLAGFHRLVLAPGQAKRVVFQLDASQLAYYNRKLEYVVEPGRIDLMVGASSTDIRSRRRLTVQGDRRLFKQQQRLATQSHDQDISP